MNDPERRKEGEEAIQYLSQISQECGVTQTELESLVTQTGLEILASDYLMAVLRVVRDNSTTISVSPPPGLIHTAPFGTLRERGFIDGVIGSPCITFLGRVVLAAHENKFCLVCR